MLDGRSTRRRSGSAGRRFLEALVVVAIANGDQDGARAAADELARLAGIAATPLLDAIAATADGRVRLASEDPRGALAAFRRAADLWQGLDAPYEAARVREGIGLACRALGDEESAAIEPRGGARRVRAARRGPGRSAARRRPGRDAARRRAGSAPARSRCSRLLARGETNREIATALGISERTVDRHVSNIYTKLDVSSRAAATAFAYEQGIVAG